MRVVFDTNIYVSTFAIPGGHAEEAYLGAIHGRVVRDEPDNRILGEMERPRSRKLSREISSAHGRFETKSDSNGAHHSGMALSFPTSSRPTIGR